MNTSGYNLDPDTRVVQCCRCGQMVRIPEDQAKVLEQNGIKVCCQNCVGENDQKGQPCSR